MMTRHPVLLLTAFVAFKSAFGADDNCPNRRPDVGCNLDVSFEDVEAFCNQIPTSSVASAPTIECHSPLAHSGKFFVLLMVDPDAPRPCPAPSGYYLHWLAVVTVTNVGVVKTTRTYVNYVPPTPPQGTHRYQLLMYRLSSSSLPTGAVPDKRSGFSLEDFRASVGLQENPDASFQFLYEP
ncbi:phosphatidylethanolamine-binding protein 4-like isoform X1 [Pomacea canaliculata]|uniref:phosphatidylethanolamine-binding protein 4-like isoform X1 n=2 Tax=Pomacea canaliculata TaxID=400727 RepID=UPI000D73F6CD|nr:phosphatidylethanolamine-binding protein 4-like isoform X1 [Pomacea canaliculata]